MEFIVRKANQISVQEKVNEALKDCLFMGVSYITVHYDDGRYIPYHAYQIKDFIPEEYW